MPPAARPRGTRNMLPVVQLDPRPANAAVRSVASAPNDGFFTPAGYRGAFAAGPIEDVNWACEWTAASRFGFLCCDAYQEGSPRGGSQTGPSLAR
jgi:hypothetical protein